MRDEKEITLTLGQPPSLNAFYSGRHWTYRKRIGDEYKRTVKDALIPFDDLSIRSYRIHIRYNSRYDCDNSILCSKFVSDALVESGFVEDDSPLYCGQVKISFDETLPKKTYIVKIMYYER